MSDADREFLKLLDKLRRTREQWAEQRTKLYGVLTQLKHPAQAAKVRARAKQLSACIDDVDFMLARNRDRERAVKSEAILDAVFTPLT